MNDLPPDTKDVVQNPVDPVDVNSPVAAAPAKDVSLDAALSEDAEKQKKRKGGGIKGLEKFKGAKLEQKHIIIGSVGVGLLMIILMFFTSGTNQGSMPYGICSTYLEMNTPYPHTLRHIALEGSQTAVRIYYTHVDPFGEFKQEMIECTFAADSQGNARVAQIAKNRKPIDAEELKKFNNILGTVIASDPYRVPPPNWENPLLSK